MAIRSGRFQASISNADEPITIVKGRTDVFYRVFNSSPVGGAVFKLHYGTNEEWPIKPTFSLDVVVANSLQVSTDSGTPVEVEGIYEYLDTQRETRSGRFRLRTADNPVNKHKIISTQSGEKAYYRIFNSGDYPFKVWDGTNNVLGQDGMGNDRLLQIGQSVDFEAGANKDFYVNSPAGKEISGIYDFLGTD